MVRVVGAPRKNTQATRILGASLTAPETSCPPQTAVFRPTDRAAKLTPLAEDCSEFRWFSAAYVTAINQFRRAPSDHLLFICNPHYRAIDGGKKQGRDGSFHQEFPAQPS